MPPEKKKSVMGCEVVASKEGMFANKEHFEHDKTLHTFNYYQ